MVTHNTDIIEAPDFIYLAAMMKSSSTLMWVVLDAIRNSNNRPDHCVLDGVPANDFMPLSLEFLHHFPRGGVFKNHAPYEYHTDRFLKQAGCKYVVLIRHPADHLAAFYCHQHKLPASLKALGFSEEPAERKTTWSFAAGQIPNSFFKQEQDGAIGGLIRDGYLFKILVWMSDWIAFRHKTQSRLLRYEDVVSDFKGVVTELCMFIRGVEPDDDLLQYLTHVFNHEAEEGRKKGATDKYPKGWTGHTGTWRVYFSAQHILAYNATVERFVSLYPQGRLLLDHYPDLLLRDRRLEADTVGLIENS